MLSGPVEGELLVLRMVSDVMSVVKGAGMLLSSGSLCSLRSMGLSSFLFGSRQVFE